jgi:hypothetical protein
MKSTDRIKSIFLVLLAIGYAGAGWHLDLYTPLGPGPGLVPKFLAVILILLSVIIWLEAGTDTPPSSGEAAEWGTPMIVLVILFCFIPMLWLSGYTVATFSMVLAIRRVFRPGRWWTDTVGAAVVALSAQVIFVEILKLQIKVIPEWIEWMG